MEESGPDTSDHELFEDEDLAVTLTSELDEAYEALGKTTKDVLEAPGKITIKKVLMVVHRLSEVVSAQHSTLKYLLLKDQINDKKMENFEDTLLKHEQKLTITKPELKSTDRDTLKTPQNKKTYDTENIEDFIPKSLLLDHFDNYQYEKSNVTLYGMPIQELETVTAKTKGNVKEAINEIGLKIVKDRMESHEIKVRSFSRIKNTKFDKCDTFRILIRFQSPYDATRFVEQCKIDGIHTVRKGLTRLERRYAKNATDEMKKKNATLDPNSNETYVKKGLFRVVKIKKTSDWN